MIELRHRQLSFADQFVLDESRPLREPWMARIDQVLEDDELLGVVFEALANRRPQSRRRGRLSTPAEVVIRMLLLKHIRNWSYQVLEREVRPNLVYRDFTRVGSGKVPDAKTMGRLALVLGPEVIQQIHRRVIEIARREGVVEGRKMRVDTTVVETNIHYPTDSTLLGDGVRVLTRVMKELGELTTRTGARLRDRSRSVKLRILEIGRASRSRGEQAQRKREVAYEKLLESTQRVVGQAKRFVAEIAGGVKRALRGCKSEVAGCREQLEEMIPRVEQVIRQTRQRIFGGDTHAEGKLFSLFEPHTEIIRKGKASKPNEFGKMVKIQEAENQMVIDYQVYEQRPADSDLLVAAVETHQEKLGRAPHLAAADAAFYSARNEEEVRQRGVKRVSIPNRSTKSPERKREQKKRWFKRGQKWRTGCEGRISVLKRRHGLRRSLYRGLDGIKRWVGLGVIADNLIQIGTVLASRE